MLNNKGYTLVELLATVVILGIIMAVTIPNITGISDQNKITTYAEDAKKFKSTAEYMFRGDDTVAKPTSNGQCVIVSLEYLHGNEFDEPPHGGEYLMKQSYVVMVKRNNRYNYYVQLVEKFKANDRDNYNGFCLINSNELEGNDYLEKVTESTELAADFVNIDLTTIKSQDETNTLTPAFRWFRNITGCGKILGVYYPEEENV